MQNRSSSHVLKKYFGWIRYISVEPTMWLYIMAYMITSVVEQALFVYKSCRVNHGFSEEVCQNIKQNDTVKNIVQVRKKNFFHLFSIWKKKNYSLIRLLKIFVIIL